MSDSKTGSSAAAAVYRGRFAPSPTGPLHFGSLVAALASYLQARSAGGEWLVRIEDIDPSREQPGATDSIIRSLETHGFEFETPLMQSKRLPVYEEITAALLAGDMAYPCSCSRKELRATAARGIAGPIYPGTCRTGADTSIRPAASVRVRTSDIPLEFADRLQGTLSCCPLSEIGDFLIRRGDGLVAYQLAVVVDDHFQRITEVVRGTDLLDATFMQICLQQALGYVKPAYLHFPVATTPDGRKLSKQNGARPLDEKQPSGNLFEALKFLNQQLDSDSKHLIPKDLLELAVNRWDPDLLQGVRSRSIGV